MKLGKRSSKLSRTKAQKSSRSDSGTRKAKRPTSRSSSTRRRTAESSRKTTKPTTKSSSRSRATAKADRAKTKRDKTKKKTTKAIRGKVTKAVDDLEITEEPIILMDHEEEEDEAAPKSIPIALAAASCTDCSHGIIPCHSQVLPEMQQL